MAEDIQKYVFDLAPASAIADETIAIMTVPKGSSVLWVQCQRLVKGYPAFADGDMTATIGDAGDPDGLVTVFDLDSGSLDVPVGTQGAYLTTAGGKLYGAATAINITYDYTAGSTGAQTVVNPRLRVIVAIGNWQG